jgi:xanthine dehydrogenase accessory factor
VRDSLDVPDALREQLHTPAGLAIGAETPEEIAIAILAEFVSKRVAQPPPALVAPVQTAIDPVCGMTVTISDATLHADIGGERFWFCSEGCRTAYIERNVTA